MKGRLQHFSSTEATYILTKEIDHIEGSCLILTNNINDLVDYHQIEQGDLKVGCKSFRVKEMLNYVTKVFRYNH